MNQCQYSAKKRYYRWLAIIILTLQFFNFFLSFFNFVKRCVMLPTVESFDTEATACVPVVAEPKCDKVSAHVISTFSYMSLVHLVTCH